jgi:cell division protein FtsN
VKLHTSKLRTWKTYHSPDGKLMAKSRVAAWRRHTGEAGQEEEEEEEEEGEDDDGEDEVEAEVEEVEAVEAEVEEVEAVEAEAEQEEEEEPEEAPVQEAEGLQLHLSSRSKTGGQRTYTSPHPYTSPL